MLRRSALALAPLALLAVSGVARAQAGGGAAPTLAEAVANANALLAANPSPWRPCQGAAQLALSEQGYLEVTTTRTSYCADSRVRIHVNDIDEARVTVEVDVEGGVVVGCKGGQDCVRHFRRRKIRSEDGGWETKEERWVPDGPATMPHLAGEARVELLSDKRVAEQVAAAIRYIARSATAVPEAYEPVDPYGDAVAQLAAPGAP